MKRSEQREETDAEFLARLRAIRERRKAAQAAAVEAAKPKLQVTVTPKMAEAVKANPESLRVSAKADDDTVVIDRPRRTEVIEVTEVDGQGRPSHARRYETAAGKWSTLEFEGGYRKPSGAESNYDPYVRFDAERRG